MNLSEREFSIRTTGDTEKYADVSTHQFLVISTA
tara:strand:- start:930 stop:1031 length:102 start_codon:yes stop_codon:yes gene_type:complete